MKRLAFGAIFLVACAGTPARTDGGAEAIASYRASFRAHEASASGAREGGTPSAPAAATGRLGPEAAVALAKKNNPRLVELAARAEAAKEAIEVAGQRRNPTLQARQVRVDRMFDGEPRLSPLVRFRPERPGEIPALEAEARAAEASARAGARAAGLAREAEVRGVYDDVGLLDAEAKAAESLATARRRLAEETRARTGTGTSTAIDADLTELSALEAEDTGRERRARRGLARAALLDRVGVAPSSEADVVTDGSVTPAWPPAPLPAEDKLVEVALRRDARVAGMAANVDGAEARLRRERVRRIPWLTFVDVGYAFTPGSEPGFGWFVGAGVDLPVLQTNAAGVRTAEAAKDASRRGLESEADRVAREVRSRLREVEAAVGLVTQLRKDAAPVLVRAEQDAARALEVAGIDTVKAALVEERRAAVELRVLAGMRRYRTAMNDLRRAMSGDVPAASR